MAAVDIRSGVKYGFLLLGYFLILFLVGGVIVAIGAEFAIVDSLFVNLIGAIIILVGLLVLYAGLLGVSYKIIADGVETGVRSALDRDYKEENTTDDSIGNQLINAIGPNEERETNRNRPD